VTLPTKRSRGLRPQAIRVLRIYRDLLDARPGGLWVDEIAKQHEVSERTVERDMQAIVAAGVGVERVVTEGEVHYSVGKGSER
jgi:predicted DNA-binding transcriptional regulator YafY